MPHLANKHVHHWAFQNLVSFVLNLMRKGQVVYCIFKPQQLVQLSLNGLKFPRWCVRRCGLMDELACYRGGSN